MLLPDAVVRRGKDRVWLHVLLLFLTFVTTTMIGTLHYASFASNFGMRPVRLSAELLWYGLPYSLTILSILGSHEMGHYLACRYYKVDATLPFFIPTPPFPFMLTGTFGAVIRIRQQILWKKALFDIGIAGPIAGFVVAVPALFLGMWLSNVKPVPPNMEGLSLGEPLLFKAAAWLVWGKPPVPFEVNMHPIAFAAWFGLLATAFNLFPIAQLDGGHIAYAMFGRRVDLHHVRRAGSCRRPDDVFEQLVPVDGADHGDALHRRREASARPRRGCSARPDTPAAGALSRW